MAVTAAQQVEMDQKDSAVRTALEAAESATGMDTLGLVRTVLGGLLPILTPAARTDAQDAAAHNVAEARGWYTQWADTTPDKGWRWRAEHGQNFDGYTYSDSVTFWLQYGDTLLSSLGAHVKAFDQGSYATVLSNTASQSAKDVANLAKGLPPDGWPEAWKKLFEQVKKGLWVAGGVAAVGVAVWGVAEVAPLLALLRRRKG